MATDPRLEIYLESLERALKPLPTSERAEIVTEIKSHVLSALERDPQKPLDDVLHALGAPETVANRYLMENGSAPVKPPISPIVKWLVIGFLGTFAMMLLFAGFLIYQARHIVTVDAVNEHVSVLGGLIDVDGKKDQVRIGGKIITDDDYERAEKHVSGYMAADPTFKSTLIRFNAGKIKIAAGNGTGLDWDCSGVPAKLKKPTEVKQGQIILDFTTVPGVKCQIQTPPGMAIHLDGGAGKIAINAQPESAYRYELHVGMGKVDSFPRNNDPKLPVIQAELKTGKIQNDSASSGAEE